MFKKHGRHNTDVESTKMMKSNLQVSSLIS
jgi:hypothetical protein